MACSTGAKIVTSGLLFYYDTENTKKSFIGRPTTNIFGGIPNIYIDRSPKTQYTWDGYSWVGTYPGISGPTGVNVGLVNKYTSGALSSTWAGNSYGYILNQYTLTNGATYNMSAWVYVSGDCNIDAIPISVEQQTSAASISGYSTTYNMSAKGTWQRLALSFVASTSLLNIIPVYPQKYGVTDGSFTGYFMLASPMLEATSYPSATPLNGTRSVTQGLVDLTNTGSTDLTSSAFDATGNLTFNASGYFSIPTNFGTVSAYTIAFWARRDVESVMPISSHPSGPAFYWYGDNSWYYTHSGGAGERYYAKPTSIPLGTWGYYCVTYDGSTVTIYRQGIYQDSVASTGTATFSSGFRIGCHTNGGYLYTGLINKVQIYNRALSAIEVKQNFNALRSQVGI